MTLVRRKGHRELGLGPRAGDKEPGAGLAPPHTYTLLSRHRYMVLGHKDPLKRITQHVNHLFPKALLSGYEIEQG